MAPRRPDPDRLHASPVRVPVQQRELPLLAANGPVSYARVFVLHVALQPSSSGGPFAFHRGGRNAEDFRSFLDGESAKESKFNQPALLRIQARKPVQRVIKRD